MATQQRNGAPTPPARTASPPPAPSRMSLSAVVRGKQQKPVRVCLYGVEGIGKSTFGSHAPEPIFLGAEEGTSQLDVARLPQPESWTDVLDGIRVLTTDEHPYKTLVVDTLDWAEPLLWDHICKANGQKNIEAFGYGKGYEVALVEWRSFLAALERMRAAKSMHVIFLAHAQIKPFKNPEGEDYDRYQMKLHHKAGAMLREWCDDVLFAKHETFASKDTATKRVRGVSTGARLVFTTQTAAFDAKNRHSLPESMPLSWADYWEAVQSGKPAEFDNLVSEIKRKAGELGGDIEKKVLDGISRAGSDVVRLSQLNTWCNGKLADKAEQPAQ
jgi:hypothetical protein